MEFLLVFLLLAVFIGPSAYRVYERWKSSRERKGEQAPRSGPSYGRRMLRMLTPVFILAVCLGLLAIGVQLLAR